MQFLVYILVYPLLWVISILPFKLLYIISDGLYILIYRIFGYRKNTVKENLQLVFPEKSKKEINAIIKKFYHHMCDMFLEMIKSMSISEESLKKRFIIINPEELKRLEALDKSIVLMYGHYASYEWSIVIEQYLSFQGYGVYKRLKNKYFDRLARNIRSKFNTTLIHTKETFEKLTEVNAKNQRVLVAFISDQSPKAASALYWTEFMNIKVPCYTGAEVLAKKLNYSVAYLKVKKQSRGFYTAEIITLTENALDYPNFELTNMFLREVEKQILEAPEYYLWTHKRWKHRDKVPLEFQ